MNRRGLFGKSMAGDNAHAMPHGYVGQGGVAQQSPAGFWQGGNKFTLRDGLAGALAAIGDGLSNYGGGGGGAVNSLLQQRAAPGQQAAALAEEQRKRAAELADYGAKKEIDQKYQLPQTPKIGVFEDNAGNRWRYDEATGQVIDKAPSFIDNAPRFIQQDGAILSVPNPYGGRQQQPAARTPAPRPQGMTDEQLFTQGRQAVEAGADVNEVFARLKAWGVKVN